MAPPGRETGVISPERVRSGRPRDRRAAATQAGGMIPQEAAMSKSASPRRTMPRVISILASVGLIAGMLVATTGPAAATGGAEGVPALGHVFVIIGENTQLSQLNTNNSPYLLGTLKPQSAWLTNYWATTHYSESNYVALTSGQFTACEQADGTTASCHQNVDNLFQQMATAGTSFTTWSESMPSPCYLFNTGGAPTLNHYAPKHKPQLFYINAHGGLLIVTFDEGVTSSPKRAVKFGNGGNVAFAAWGPQVHPAVYPGGPYTHYSFLRTLQDGYGLTSYLGDAANVTPIVSIWKP